MRRLVRENALCVLAAAGASVAMGWLGLNGFTWSDYEVEAQPALDALTHGHVLEFLRLAPAYGGSLVERAPFALLPGLWGGGQLAVYRMVAVPCLLAGAVLGVWLCARMRAAGRPVLWRAVALGICVANPLTLQALEQGHPEELMGACLCVGAVLLAGRGRPIWAGVLLGLAIANKEWALLAAGPVLLALPADTRASASTGSLLRAGESRRRQVTICLASASAAAAIVLAPLLLASDGRFAASTSAAAVPQQEIFLPQQVWWFLGAPNHIAAPANPTRVVPLNAAWSTHPEWRLAPSWLTGVAHPLIIVVGFVLAGAVWLRRRRIAGLAVSVRDALLTLAIVMLARCVLDTWDTAYYAIPFVLALLSWEVCGEGARRPPVLALASTILAWLSFLGLSEHGVSPDMQAAFFLAWTLPLCAWIALRLYAPTVLTNQPSAGEMRAWPAGLSDTPELPPAPSPAGIALGPCAAQEMTVSSLGSPVSTS
jgi:hypothetical protein